MYIEPRFFARPRCPHCESGHLKRTRFGFYCKGCHETFSEQLAVRPEVKPRTRSGSGQIAGPCYYTGLKFPGPGGRRRAG